VATPKTICRNPGAGIVLAASASQMVACRRSAGGVASRPGWSGTADAGTIIATVALLSTDAIMSCELHSKKRMGSGVDRGNRFFLTGSFSIAIDSRPLFVHFFERRVQKRQGLCVGHANWPIPARQVVPRSQAATVATDAL